MTTVGALVDRAYRQILEPPDAQPASSRLSVAALIDDLTLSLTEFDIPEDENLLRLGSIIEVGQELMRVTDFVASTRVVTVLRGYLGSTAAAHDISSEVKLSPPYPRLDVFNAVRDNIVGLYPDLWTVKTEVIAPATNDAFPLTDPLAVEVVEVNPYGTTKTINVDGRIVDNHPAIGGKAFIVNGIARGEMWLRYRRRFGTATSEADLLDELGLEEVWHTLVIVGAAADMMAGGDVQASHTEWVQSVLEAESIRVGTRMSIAGGLAQYRDLLMGRFRKEMRAEDSNKPKVHMREAWG